MSELRALVAEELSMPVDARVSALAAAIASRHGGASCAVLFYGSCLREKKFEGLMLDFYLIVSSYREAYDRNWLAAANRLIPPNVFYFEKDGIAAKYAVLSEGDFYRLNGPETRSVSVWARFAQPSRLVWAANERARERAIEAVSRAAPTLLEAAGRARRKAARLVAQGLHADLFGGAPRRAERARRVIRRSRPPALHPVHEASGGCIDRHSKASWRRRRIEGKLLSVARLAKASATFAGGADYIAWKINRHAGTSIRLKPWQQRHPLLAAISLLPRLIRSGAVR